MWFCVPGRIRVTWIVVRFGHRQVRSTRPVHPVPCLDPGVAAGRGSVGCTAWPVHWLASSSHCVQRDGTDNEVVVVSQLQHCSLGG